jgi:hypothetical protein
MARLALLLAAVALVSPADNAASARRKIELIQQDWAAPGSTVAFTPDELNAYIREEAAKVAPEGVRDPRIVPGNGRATGYAFIDFAKLRESQGEPMPWLLAKIFGGERRVRVDARIRSGKGRATVFVERVEISGIVIRGSTLQWLIRNVLWSYYPDAKVGKPFELAHNIERIEVTHARVSVMIGH